MFCGNEMATFFLSPPPLLSPKSNVLLVCMQFKQEGAEKKEEGRKIQKKQELVRLRLFPPSVVELSLFVFPCVNDWVLRTGKKNEEKATLRRKGAQTVRETPYGGERKEKKRDCQEIGTSEKA